MLTGKTSVYIDTVKSDDDPPPAPPKPDPAQQQLLAEMEEEGTATEEEQKKKKKLDRSQYGRFIISFDAGKSFGEIALISKEAVRNASIIADEETDMLVIDRELFNGTLKAKQEQEYRERKEFVNKCPIFQGWSTKFKRLCEMSLRKETLPFDSYLFKQGEPLIGLHFIIKGQAKVVVDPASHKHQYPKLFQTDTSVLAKELGRSFQKKEEAAPRESYQQEQVRVRRRQGYAAAERRLAQKAMTLCFVDESEILGDTELVLGLDTYSQTVKCTSNMDLFILDNKNIDRLIYKKNPYTMDKLRDKVERKLKIRQSTKVGKQIELYTYLIDKIEDMKPKKPLVDRYKRERKTPVSRRVLKTQQTNIQKDPPPRPQTAHPDNKYDRDQMMSQLVKMFLENKSPLIEPSVPGTVYYKAKSADKAKHHFAERLRKRAQEHSLITPEVRLSRARKAAKRQARSRRELERLTIAQDTEGMKQLQDKNHAVNRILNQVNSRPQSSPHYRGMLHSESVSPTSGGARSPDPRSPDERIFRLTEPDPDELDDQMLLDVEDMNDDAVKRIVLDMNELSYVRNSSRAKIVCSMMEKKTNQMTQINGLTRPKSAPAIKFGGGSLDDEAEAEEGSFDWETGESNLRDLEDKIRTFHEKYDQEGGKHMVAQVPELRRFSMQSLEDAPVPGGTVYVRQRTCKYPAGTYVNPAHHQHMRRYIVPRNAYDIITHSMSSLYAEDANGDIYYNGKGRPKSAMTSSTTRDIALMGGHREPPPTPATGRTGSVGGIAGSSSGGGRSQRSRSQIRAASAPVYGSRVRRKQMLAATPISEAWQ